MTYNLIAPVVGLSYTNHIIIKTVFSDLMTLIYTQTTNQIRRNQLKHTHLKIQQQKKENINPSFENGMVFISYWATWSFCLMMLVWHTE